MDSITPTPAGNSAGTMTRSRSKSQLVGIRQIPISEILPSPENDDLYGEIDAADREVRQLRDSIRERGIIEPLVVTADSYIVSGHRRYVAAKLARLTTLPCRVLSVLREGMDRDDYLVLLREHNRQRNKTFAQKLREELVTTNPADAHDRLVLDRIARSEVKVEAIELAAERKRATISAAKQPMVDAVKLIINARRKFWPLSDRQIHYPLLNDPPLRHASKRKSRYRNDRASYGDLCDLLLRMRLDGLVPWEAIADPTRPVLTWGVYADPQLFLRDQLDCLLSGYYRNLLQSQPNHIEVVVEKNTLTTICRPICGKYCAPMTSSRGFCSAPTRHEMAKRYRRSGKDKLVVLLISDFDPEGEAIAESFGRSMRDDFGVANVHPVKVALTAEQIERYQLPPAMEVKGGSRRDKFVAKHGKHVWEVEALPPETLQKILDESIRSVLDLDLFNREVEAEKSDAAMIESARKIAIASLQGIDFGGEVAE